MLKAFKAADIFDFRIINLTNCNFLILVTNFDFELINGYHKDYLKYFDIAVTMEYFGTESYIFLEVLFHLSKKLKIISYYFIEVVDSNILISWLTRSLNSKKLIEMI